MGLFSSRKAREAPAAERGAAANTAADPVQAARAKARRRLVGAAVLLGVGVIGFPLLFETQPRPIPVDIAIDIPRKDNAPSLPLPPPRVASAAATTPRISSGVISERPPLDAPPPKRDAAPAPGAKSADVAPPASKPAATSPPPPPKQTATANPGVAASATPAGATPGGSGAPRGDDGARAQALLEGKPVESRAAPAGRAAGDAAVAVATPKPAATASPADGKADGAPLNGRFVVQVAAYSEAGAAREMRQRLEKLGLKSYTQVIEVDGAKRIRVRVGPFGARDDADKAAATLKAAGLPAAVLSL